MKKAFTFVEIVIVIAMLGLLLGLSVLYFQTSQLRADVHAQTSTFVSYLRVAQSGAESGLDGTGHGIHLESDSYTIFTGSTYDPAEASNFTIELPPTVMIQNIFLNGGGSDVIFNPPSGETNTYGSLEFYSSRIDTVIPITVSQWGTIDY